MKDINPEFLFWGSQGEKAVFLRHVCEEKAQQIRLHDSGCG